MAKKKYFRTPDSELCYTLDYHVEIAKSEGLEEIELYEAMPERIRGALWCRAVDEYTEVGNCGKICEFYKPRNNVSGMCKYRSNTLYSCGKKVKFNLTV